MISRAQIFVTSDHHFGHSNIITYCNRPFQSARDMDEAMVTEWNRWVCPDDVVYHLGDFTLNGITVAAQYFRQLNGLIYVLGNYWHHDKRWLRYISMDNLMGPSGLRLVSKSGYPIQILPSSWNLDQGRDKPPVILSHYPYAEWDRKHYGSIHLHGHSHGKSKVIKGRMDVGVDCTHFRPVLVEHVLEKIRLRDE